MIFRNAGIAGRDFSYMTITKCVGDFLAFNTKSGTQVMLNIDQLSKLVEEIDEWLTFRSKNPVSLPLTEGTLRET